MSPLYAAFVTYLHYAAGLEGSQAPDGRLDPPLWLGLDEVTTICPIPLPKLLSDSAGKGVLMTAVCHGTSQLAERWGQSGARTIWACCGTKVLLHGISDAATLEEISDLTGTVGMTSGERDEYVRIVPPELVRSLPAWRALILRMDLSPVVVKIRPAWKRRKVRKGGPWTPPLRYLPPVRPAAEEPVFDLSELLPDPAPVPARETPPKPVPAASRPAWLSRAAND